MRRLLFPALLLAQLKQQRIPAVSIAVVRNGEPVKLQSGGRQLVWSFYLTATGQVADLQPQRE